MSTSYSFLGSREIAGGARLAGVVPGPHLHGGIFRKNARSDLQPDDGAKVNLEHPHSPPPASLPFPEGVRVCSGCKPGSSEYLLRAWGRGAMGRRGLAFSPLYAGEPLVYCLSCSGAGCSRQSRRGPSTLREPVAHQRALAFFQDHTSQEGGDAEAIHAPRWELR